MDTFRTGRTRRLTLSWDFTMKGLYRSLFPHGEAFTAVTGFHVRWLGFEVWAGSPNDVCGNTSTGAPPHGYHLPIAGPGPDGLTYIVQIRPPGGDYYNEYGPWGNPGEEFPAAAYAETPASAPTDFVVEGAVSLYVDVEEWKEISVDTQTPRAPLDYPTSGEGPADDDFLGLCTARYYEGPKPNGEWGFTIAIEDGYGASAHGIIPAGPAGPDAFAHLPLLKAHLRPSEDDPISGGIGATELYLAPVNFDLVDFASAAFTATGDDQGNLTVSATATGIVHPPGPYLVSCRNASDTQFQVDGVTTRLFEENYGAPVVYRRSWADPPEVTKTDGVYSGAPESYTEQQADVERCDSGTPVSLLHAEALRPELFLWLDNAWLSARGELEQDWRILISDDRAWAPFELRHRPQVTVDDFSSLAGWSGENVSLSLEGGAMRIDVSGGIGWVAKAFDRDCSQHRKLRVRARADQNGAGFRVTLNGSALTYWDPRITTTMQSHDMDLCAPKGGAASYDLTDTSHVEPGEFYGPRTIEEARLDALEDGRTYWVESLALARTGGAAYTALPPFDEATTGDDGVTRWRLCWGLSDKRQALDLPYRTDDGQQDRFWSVEELVAAIVALDAYDVRVTRPLNPSNEAEAYYLDHAARPAAFLASEHYPDGSRVDLDDASIGGSRPIWSLHRFDKVEIYPGIGNPAAGYAGPYPLRFAKRLRAAVHGLVINNATHRAQPGETVRLKLAGTERQAVVTDSDGYYRTAPFRPAAGSWTVGTEISGDVALSSGLTDRKYRWAGLAGGVEVLAGPTAIAADATGRLYVPFTDEAGLLCRRVDLLGSAVDTVIEPDVSPTGIGIAWSPPHRLHVVYESGGAIVMRVSNDDAQTWEDPVTVFANGSYPNIQSDPINGMIYAFRHDGTGIACRRSLDGGATWQSEVTVIDECPEQQCGVTIRPDMANTIYVSYRDGDGAIRLAVSKDNGLTWE